MVSVVSAPVGYDASLHTIDAGNKLANNEVADPFSLKNINLNPSLYVKSLIIVKNDKVKSFHHIYSNCNNEKLGQIACKEENDNNQYVYHVLLNKFNTFKDHVNKYVF